jgi:cytochrome P450
MTQTTPNTSASTAARPPLAKGLPYLGNALQMRIDPLAYFVRLYHELGPVFRVVVLGHEYWVMGGIEANRFLARENSEFFGSESLFGGLAEQLGSNALLVAIDGPAHRHQRKIQRRGFSREKAMQNIDLISRMTSDDAKAWTPEMHIPLFPTFQRLITEQLAVILTGRKLGAHFTDLFTLTSTVMKVHVLKTHPKFFLQLPGYQAARNRMLALGKDILDDLRANPPAEGKRDANVIDDLIAAVDENGQPYDEQTLIGAVTGGFFAGMDTAASTASFMVYAILSTPGLKARVLEEVDRVFDAGGITPEAIRQMSVLHHTAIETLRMYPIAPFTPRTVVKAFEFGGYTFPVGTEVYVAQTITHYLPEYFADAARFDIDRHDREDATKTPHTFAPYSLGAHTCLGAGMAEVQLMTVIATLFRTLDFDLNPPGAKVVQYANPIPNPGPTFGIKINGPRKAGPPPVSA